jgi:hypothetical protein
VMIQIYYPGHRGGIGSCRIWIFLSDPTRFFSDSFRSESGPDFIGIRRNPMKSESDLVGLHRAPLNSDEIRTGFQSKGIRLKPCWIRLVFYERCRIPIKSNTDPIKNDRIYRSDHLTWVSTFWYRRYYWHENSWYYWTITCSIASRKRSSEYS